MSTAASGRTGEFKNVIRSRAPEAALPVDEYLAELDRLIVMVLRDARSRALNRLLDEALAER